MQGTQRTRVGLKDGWMDGSLAGWLAGGIERIGTDMADLEYGERKENNNTMDMDGLHSRSHEDIFDVHTMDLRQLEFWVAKRRKESRKIEFDRDPLNDLDEGPSFMIIQTTTTTTAAPSRSSSIS